jgi:hypothetical protein
MEFMQDKAYIHTTNIIKNWFDEIGLIKLVFLLLAGPHTHLI